MNSESNATSELLEKENNKLLILQVKSKPNKPTNKQTKIPWPESASELY
jgi:hypothetical protein